MGRFLLALVWYGYITGEDVGKAGFSRFDREVGEREYGIAIAAAEEALRL